MASASATGGEVIEPKLLTDATQLLWGSDIKHDVFRRWSQGKRPESGRRNRAEPATKSLMPGGHHQLTTPYYSTQLSLVGDVPGPVIFTLAGLNY